MLLILYGTSTELGKRCREYLITKGYELVEKYAYAENKPLLKEKYGKRNWVSKKESEEKTDSLFRYNIPDIEIGFKWEQISDALIDDPVGNKKQKHALLTVSTDNITMLRKIKEVYKNSVKIVYCFVSPEALSDMYMTRSDMTVSEYQKQIAFEKKLKQCYSVNPDVFDKVIMFTGEGTDLDFASIFRQLDAIAEDKSESEERAGKNLYDIFVFYSGKDNYYVHDLMDSIRFYVTTNIRTNYDSADCLEDIERTRLFIPVVSDNVVNDDHLREELVHLVKHAEDNGVSINAIAFGWNKKVYELNFKYVYSVNPKSYNLGFIEDWLSSMFHGQKQMMSLLEEGSAF